MRRELVGFLLPCCALAAFGLAAPLGFILWQSVAGDDGPSLHAYAALLDSRLFLRVSATTVEIALSATALSAVLAYPVALHLSRLSDRTRPFFLVLVVLPFWTSILVKSYAFLVILGDQGLVNQALVATGLPKAELIFNRIGVMVGMTNFLIPFVVFPLLANLRGQDPHLRRAAAVMGASPLRIFWRVTFPLSLPGLLAGMVMCFVISLGFFVTPALLGGRRDMMLANLVDFYTREILDWPTASAVAVLLLLASSLLLALLRRVQGAGALV